VIRIPTTVYVASTRIDLRLSFDRLAGIVREVLGHEPRAAAAFVFHNRARTHAKILWHDGRGYCLLSKRLGRGTYRIPLAVPPGAKDVPVTPRELALLFEGIDHALVLPRASPLSARDRERFYPARRRLPFLNSTRTRTRSERSGTREGSLLRTAAKSGSWNAFRRRRPLTPASPSQRLFAHRSAGPVLGLHVIVARLAPAA